MHHIYQCSLALSRHLFLNSAHTDLEAVTEEITQEFVVTPPGVGDGRFPCYACNASELLSDSLYF